MAINKGFIKDLQGNHLLPITRGELVLDKIAVVENLLPTDEDIEDAIKTYAEASKLSVKDVEKRIGKGAFAAQIANNNAIKLILETKIVK